jgi:hypothetical protein
MDYTTWDADPDFEWDDEIPHAKLQWHGSTIEVKARLVPRYLFSTASIDVFLDGQCILRTGGQMKATGSSWSEFEHGGSTHVVELSWDRVAGVTFPYTLRINDAEIAWSDVSVENPVLFAIPVLILYLPWLIGIALAIWTG